MLVDVLNLENKPVDKLEFSDDIVSTPVYIDIIKRVIDWQLLKRMRGTHKTKTVSEVSGTTKKPYKQKGTGNARQGSLRSVQMRGGGVIHGPNVRSHAISLNKKVRRLGLRTALSAKFSEGNLLIIDDFNLATNKTSEMVSTIKNFKGKSFLLVDVEGNDTLRQSVSNLYRIDYLPVVGLNVYDIVKHEVVMISKRSLEEIYARVL